jgi:DNA modification methylase
MIDVSKLDSALASIDRADHRLTKSYESALEVNHNLDRSLVSFQANKASNGDRWCKYKEGFSTALIHYFLDEVSVPNGPILDPFAGSGTTLYVCAKRGINCAGIELLPHSAEIIRIRSELMRRSNGDLASELRAFATKRTWEKKQGSKWAFPHLRITSGAFPSDTERLLGRYMDDVNHIDDPLLASVLRFACMCILESISFTRKDGQYLRWDQRSGRCLGKKPFDKGKILGFTEAVTAKIVQIADDLDSPNHLLFGDSVEPDQLGTIELHMGSCLEILPKLKSRQFAGVITSPPYCNRYDYTRTYALELAFMGIGEDELKHLRQTMLSCTVENRPKDNLAHFLPQSRYTHAIDAWKSHGLLQSILNYLDECREAGTLNNNGIPRMIANYFREMAVVVFESARILKAGAPFIMVNDNVRYQGAHIPVDLILSDFAKAAGLDVERIWVLPRGKGNSSQQMGLHGRTEIRKCIYIWRKPRVKAARAMTRGQPVALRT